MKNRRVDYSGEEFLQCHPLSLEQVLPALPPVGHGGSIRAVDWVGPGTKEFLLHPERALVSDEGQAVPKLQGKVHIPPGEVDAIVHELIQRNVCDWVPLQNVMHFRGEPVLNGVFGVEKPVVLPSGKPVLRFIMNLVPSNSLLLQLTGGTRSLPYVSQWLSIVLEGDQHLRIWQSDMCSAFYLFELPEPWWGKLSFNILRKGKAIGKPDNRVYALSCKVIPMGFNSSVALMQEISENLLKVADLPRSARLTRGYGLPVWLSSVLDEQRTSMRSWYHIYLDNFCAGSRVSPPDCGEQGSFFHQLAESAWAEAGVVSSEKKRKSAVLQAEELGGYLNGELRTLGVSPERALRLAVVTLHLISRGLLNRKMVQVVAGRWVHCFQFRRACMSFFDHLWKYVGNKPSAKFSFHQVRRELFRTVASLPLMHTFLGAAIPGFITASDASSTGGAVGISRALTPEGADFATASAQAATSFTDGPFLLLSLFNGIGGALRCYDILGVKPRGTIIVELNKDANRICLRRWPHAELIEDVRSIDAELVRRWTFKYTDIIEIHLWAGFPCKDLSSAKRGRKNLKGDSSSLFFEIPRIKKLLEKFFGHRVKIKFVLENVASMDRAAAEEISAEVGVVPYFLDPCEAVPIHRPRLCWTSERWDQLMEGIELNREGYWIKVSAAAPWPMVSQWIRPDWTWPASSDTLCLPTAMRTVPKDQAPPFPAGIERCSHATLQRWEADQFRLPPYQYKDDFIFYHTTSGRWRRPSSSEKELLMGYGFQHTSLCWSASHIKQSAIGYEDCRQALIGDGFSIYSFVIAAAGLCRDFHKSVPYQELADRMGLAPGFLAGPTCRAPLSRSLRYGSPFSGISSASVGLVNRYLLTRTNHTGSDIRVATGTLMNAKAFPRQGVEANWWVWSPLFRTVWARDAHINELELRSILLGVKYIVSHLRVSDSRLFHLSDSYVCISVVAKGRTSSYRLQRVLKQLNAYLLTFGLHLVQAHVESTMNPTDAASRQA